jgi:hypothetical protein
MYKYCCTSTKMLLLAALLVLPSVFGKFLAKKKRATCLIILVFVAYGNRPEDYSKKTQASGGQTPYTAVNYWKKLMPYQLVQGSRFGPLRKKSYA